jgi:hypothetical protein
MGWDQIGGVLHFRTSVCGLEAAMIDGLEGIELALARLLSLGELGNVLFSLLLFLKVDN